MRLLRTALRSAAAAAVLATAALVAGPTSGAATVPTHVALTITGERTWCVSWHAGMTGADVLSEAGVVVTVDTRQGGLITGLNGMIESNSAVAYWSYWEDTGSGFEYSNFGAGGSHPTAGSVEGWRVDQTSGGKVAPDAVSYASICGASDAPAPAPAAPAPVAKATTSKASVAPPPAAVSTPAIVTRPTRRQSGPNWPASK